MKKSHPRGWLFPDAQKGRKGEKETGILNSVWAQSPEERECRRESENPGPDKVKRFSSLDESKYNTQKTICQVFCQIFFKIYFLGIFPRKRCYYNKIEFIQKI